MRLEAGDWVVARGVAGEASPGLGKLTGGDYEDEHLVRARVEFPAGVRWIAPGELDRVHPHVEAAILEAALERRLVPEEVAPDLTRTLDGFRTGAQEFFRTPGLLDALWVLLRGPSPTPGLARLFEADQEELLRLVPSFTPPPGPVLARDVLEEGNEDGSGDDPEQDWDEEEGEEEEADWDDWDDEEDEWDDEGLARVAAGVAAALLCGDWTQADMVDRTQTALATRADWIARLVERTLEAFVERPHPDDPALAIFVLEDEGLLDRWLEVGLEVHVTFLVPPEMRSPRFPVPDLCGAPDVARWLGMDLSDLDWLADHQRWLVREPPGPLQHYHYHWLRKRSGGKRLVEAPKELLKSVQRQILRKILDVVPPHDAAHGFRKGRSVVTFAEPHSSQDLVLRMDLRHFFPSIGAARVAATFRALGYPQAVALLLADLVTTRTPEETLEAAGLDAAAVGRLRCRHLPQGSPTSPAMANLCAYGLDVRLSAAAAAVSATYTRYADDLAFSGGEAFRKQASRFRLLVVRIATEEGFEVHWQKNRWMRPCSQQRLTGLVVNDRPRPSREVYDRLKATLFNCVQHGPLTQNRSGHLDFRAHLAGRVAWFCHVDHERGGRLRALFERISWPST